VQLRETHSRRQKTIHFPRNCLARDVLLKTRPPAIPPFIPALPQIKRHKASNYPKGKKMKPEHRQRLLAALILTAFGTPALAAPNTAELGSSRRCRNRSAACKPAAGRQERPDSPRRKPCPAADDENTASKEDINGLQADLETSSIRSSATATPAPPCRRAPST
jgi:hypothetical protein